MNIVLHDLAGADPALRFSPFCWRTKFALAHKGLSYEARPWRFSEHARLAALGAEKVPVIEDGGRAINDSWAIAVYLEETYPDRPSLFGGAAGVALARFLNAWADAVLNVGILPMVVADIWATLGEEEQAYFRKTREARFGRTLEEIAAEREARLPAFRQSLTPLRLTLRAQPWLGGDAPNYADYIVAGSLQWARVISRFPLLADDDPLLAWFGRVLDLFGGLGAAATRV
jgi:glutathione S-transferase